MDEMIIKTPWTTGIVSWIIKRAIQMKLGYNIDVLLNNFKSTVENDAMLVHLDMDLKVKKEDVDKLLKSFLL